MGSGGEEAQSRRVAFERDGFLHLRGFVGPEVCASLKGRMRQLIDRWDPDKTLAPVFSTSEEVQLKSQGNSDYFLDSADRIHFFLEEGATDGGGKLAQGLSKESALNKVGHGLHVADDVFREYSHSREVVQLVGELGWKDPVLPQSMYIFKQPKIGGEVTSHQDSGFLYTTPRPTCLGLWLALDDADLDNGCLWARPGSHLEPVRRHFVRNDTARRQAQEAGTAADALPPKMVFDALDTNTQANEWEGKMPPDSEAPSEGLKSRGFCAVPCKAGDLVVIHGQVDHLSLANRSAKHRETFQLHLIEGPGEGITWSDKNWLQYPPGSSFPALVERPA